MSLRSALRVSLAIFLVFPFLFLVTQFGASGSPDWTELAWAFKNTFTQALFSTLVSLFFGFWVSLGLLGAGPKSSSRFRSILEVLCLLPNFLPVLFVILAALSMLDPFPMGITGIVIIHSMMNFGLVAVLLSGIIEDKLGGAAELAYVEGASRWQFTSQVLFPVLKKDLRILGLFIFVICFGSFAVPLIVGAGKGTTLEVLIYEKIRLSNDWGDAVFLAFLQSSFIFVLSILVARGQTPAKARWVNLRMIGSTSGIVFLLTFSFVYIFGYLEGFVQGLSMLSTFYGMQNALIESFLGSIFIGLSVGFLTYILLMVIAFCWPKKWFETFLHSYVAPSTALTCFAFLVMSPNGSWYSYLKIILALSLLSLNSLFRMGWEGALQSLQSQIAVAHSMGASRVQTFKEVILPQITEKAGVLSGIAAIWACGDFAVSRILAHRDLSIAMMTETLMSGYRLSQANVLSGLIIIAGAICFFVCVGGSRVLRRKRSL